MVPLIFTVLRNNGVGLAATEDADEQVTLALEFLSFHADTCKNLRY